MRRITSLCVALLIGACSPSAVSTTAPAAAGSQPPSDTPATATKVESLEVDGVWTFQHRSSDRMLALHGGTPEIVEGCLVVDGLVVVWHADRIADAKAAIAAAKAGTATRIEMGGGAMSLAEGGDRRDFPEAVTTACPSATGVWFDAG